MDLPPSNNKIQSLSQTSPKTSTGKIAEHNPLSSLKPNQTISATVEKIFQLTERQLALLSRLQLSQLQSTQLQNTTPNQTPLKSTNKTNAEVIRALINQPTYLVTARANNQTVQLLTQNIALLTEVIDIRRAANGTLVAHPSGKNLNSHPLAANHTTRHSSTYSSDRVQSQSNIGQSSNATNDVRGIEGLRHHYPRQVEPKLFKNLSNVLNNLLINSVQTSEAQITRESNRHAAISPLIAVLKSLVPRASENSTIPIQALKHSLFKSGIFLESTIKNSSNQTTPGIGSKAEQTVTTPTLNHSPASSGSYSTNSNTTRPAHTKINADNFFSPRTEITSHTTPHNHDSIQFIDDNKAKLLVLESLTTQALSQIRQPDKSITPNEQHFLFQILKPILKLGPTDNSKNIESETLLKQLQLFSQSLISRITTHQLQTLSQAALENLVNPLIFQTESLLRIGDSLFPFFISIEEYTEKATKENDNKKAEKNRQWKVYMELEVEDLGYFATEIEYRQGGIKTVFWIENQEMLNSAKVSIDQLKNNLIQNGVELESYRFSHSPPPNKKQGVKHALVDITT